RDSRSLLLLTQDHLAGDLDFPGKTLILDGKLYKEEDETDLETESGPGNLLYLIYTSGTSGKPKGVLLENRNLVNYVSWFTTVCEITRHDKTILTSSYAFDLGYTLIYSSLLKGGELHALPQDRYALPEELCQYIRHHKITYLKMTPSLFSTIVESPMFTEENMQSIRLVLQGGEAINLTDVEKAHEICRHIRIMNHYGPTESTIGSVARFIDFGTFEAYKAAPTIGRPIHNTRVYILDRYARLVPTGIPGELCIGGNGVARGYLDRPELTNERFCDGPETGDSRQPTVDRRQKIYRTGDLACWLPDSNIRFLGRIDLQVKIRGFRVELGEIENRLLSHEDVNEAVVIAYEDSKGKGKYLCAYVVCESAEPADMSRLRTFLAKDLPNYMIPSYIMPLEKLPLTPNGKLDRKALPTPEIVISADTYSPPGNRVENKLVDIWAEELKLDKDSISIDSDFFQLGGHSLLAIKLIARIHKHFDIKLTLGDIFLNPTVRGLGQCIEAAAKIEYISIESAEKKEYYVVSSPQKRFYLLQQMETENTGYNMPYTIPLNEKINKEKLGIVFRELLSRHESLRTSFHIENNHPVQVIHDRPDFEIDYYKTTEEKVAT
ncbi:MAG: AMP-binding protein, partial [bacterium]|nr:AMP-binding protein [bacterium]